MLRDHFIKLIFMIACFFPAHLFAQPAYSVGQTIQIKTKLHAWDGKPSWLLVIRDIDHNQNIPYLYDFERGDNAWLAFTYGRHYLILASTLSFSPYSDDPWRTKKIHNFCNLESNGHIMRNKSMTVTLKGELTPNRRTFSCFVTVYPGSNFYIVNDNI